MGFKNSRFIFHLKNFLSCSHRTGVFVHIPKTAGHSVGRVLGKGKFRWIGHDLRNPSYLFPKDISWFGDLYSCAFVRNPYDRLVSSYYYLKSGGNCEADQHDFDYYLRKYKNFEDMILNWNDDLFNQIHFKPQSEWIYFDNKCLFNFVGRYENLQQDVNKILIDNQMNTRYVKTCNKSKHKNYTKYYNKTTSKLVYDIYETDFKNFGYNKL